MTELAPVTTVTPTIQGGTVVRWYRGEVQLEMRSEVVSASRNGVHIDAWLSSADDLDAVLDTISAALDTQVKIKRGDDVQHLATHRQTGIFGPYVEVTS